MTSVAELTSSAVELSEAMAWQHKHSTRKSTAFCGLVPLGRYVNLFLVGGDESRLVVSGLQRCDSPNVCVACSQRIGSNRRKVVADVFAQAVTSGYGIGMLTLTVRHRKGQSLRVLLEAMSKAYENLVGSQAWKVLKRDFGAEFLRVTEVTHGRNGWHPHYHVAIVARDGFDWDKYLPMVTNIWCEAVERAGLDAPLAARASHLIERAGTDDMAWYLSKAEGSLALAGASAEVSAGRWKDGRRDSVSVWQLLALAMRGDAEAAALWAEYEQAVLGKRFFNPSRNFAARFGFAWKADSEDAEELVATLRASALSGDEDPIINIMSIAMDPGWIRPYPIAWSNRG